MDMKVLLCTPYDPSGKIPGGISVWAKNIMEYNRAFPEDVTIDVLDCDRTNSINENTGNFKRLYYGIKDYLNIIKQINRKTKKHEYNVVHINTTVSWSAIKDIVLCKMMQKNGVKAILHYHFGRIPSLLKAKNWECKLVRTSIKNAHKAIVMDHDSYKALLNAGFKNVVEIPNPYSPRLETLVEKLRDNVQRKPHRVLFAGRVFKKKGVYELVRACSQIQGIELRMVGPCEEVDKNNLLEIANHGQWIDFVGPVTQEKVIEEMMGCDVFVMPTYTEGFPNAVLECMVTKTPIIVTPVGAIPEMLDFDNNPCGVKIGVKNVKDIISAIQSTIDNEGLKNDLTERAYQRVHELYSLPKVGQQLYSVWRS